MATVIDRPAQPRDQRDIHSLAPLAASLAAMLAIAAIVLAIALSLGSGASPAPSGAATVLPADTLLYLNVSTDPARPAARQALARVQRLPGAALLTGAVTSRLDAILAGSSANSVDFTTDVRPWIGDEAAFAALDTGGASAGTLIVLDVRNRQRARAFLAAHGAISAGAYRRVALLQEPSGTTLAFLGRYLVFGQAASVQAAIDVSRGARSLAHSSAYQRAAAGEPPGRVLDFYAPAAGVVRALIPSPGLLGALGVLLYQPALSAATIAVSPAPAGFSVRIHSALDPKLASPTGSSRQITPSLARSLPAGSTMLFDVPNLRSAAPKLLAAAARVGIAGRIGSLLTRLGGALVSQGVSLNGLFSIFGSQTALAIVPGRDGGGPAPVLVGRTSHRAAALAELSGLEGPLTQAFTPSSGGGLVPEAGASTIGGVTVSQLTLAPGLQLDWAVSGGVVALSTSAGAVANVVHHRASLSGEPGYRAAVGNLPSRATSLLFLDLGPLLRLGEQTGLIGGDVLTALLPDLERIRAIGLVTSRDPSGTTTELQLQIP
jgi:Protein of unknown function (DUF3352)